MGIFRCFCSHCKKGINIFVDGMYISIKDAKIFKLKKEKKWQLNNKKYITAYDCSHV